jgi:hypothetical protein
LRMRKLAIMFALSLFGCDQVIARGYGGHVDINVPNCQRLVTATWKDTDLWYLTEPMGSNEPRATVLRESSTFGQLEGSVTFRERCAK